MGSWLGGSVGLVNGGGEYVGCCVGGWVCE